MGTPALRRSGLVQKYLDVLKDLDLKNNLVVGIFTTPNAKYELTMDTEANNTFPAPVQSFDQPRLAIEAAKASLKPIADHKADRNKKVDLNKQKVEKGFMLEINQKTDLIVIVTLEWVELEFVQTHKIRFVDPKNTSSTTLLKKKAEPVKELVEA